jgi:hypothetical protein
LNFDDNGLEQITNIGNLPAAALPSRNRKEAVLNRSAAAPMPCVAGDLVACRPVIARTGRASKHSCVPRRHWYRR